MSELKSHPVSSGDIAEIENAVNGVPVELAHGRHRRRWWLGTGSGEREVPDDRTARLRLLTGSAIGVGCLCVAHWFSPEQGSLLAAPSGAVGWIAMICGIAGVWLVPGLWLSAVMMRAGAGPVAWLATRIATTLAWYAVVGPVIHHAGDGSRVTTGGIFIMTTAATAAVSLGVALGLSRRISGRWLRILVAAVVAGGCAQAVVWASKLVASGDTTYSDSLFLNSLIVLGSALLVAVGILSRPNLPPVLTARSMRTPLIALAVIATTAAALLAIGARWSPAQRMPSAFGAEQIPAPAGADVAFALTAIGPGGSEFIRRADFTASDDTGRPVPVDTRLVLADDTADRANLLVVLPRSSQPELCGEEPTDRVFKTGAPIKLNMRDQVSDLNLQAVIPIGWCAG
jgi:hypothetical protein